MDLKNVFDKSWKPALSVTLAVTVTTMWDMAAVPPMGQRVAVPPMGDRVAVPPMGDRVALSPNLVVNEILLPGRVMNTFPKPILFVDTVWQGGV